MSVIHRQLLFEQFGVGTRTGKGVDVEDVCSSCASCGCQDRWNLGDLSIRAGCAVLGTSRNKVVWEAY